MTVRPEGAREPARNPANQAGPGGGTEFPHAPESVSAARRSLGVELRRLSVAPAVADDAVLILSELVSNALKHARPLAGGKIRVAWWMEDDRILRIAVTDGGRRPRPVAVGTNGQARQGGGLEAVDLDEVDESAVDGRGLGIVGVLADAWGVEPFAADPGQPPRPDDPAAPKTVWAAVRLHARTVPPPPPDRPDRPGRPRRIAGVRAVLTALPRGAGQRIGKVLGRGVGKGLGAGGEAAKGSAATLAV
jgi:anti-sigma regulatory factor (Ser/Thr protein kinase)